MNRSVSSTILIAAVATSVICGCILLAAGLFYFSDASSTSTAQYFLTVNEVLNRKADLMGKNIRISGVVLGDTIEYDETRRALSFTIANVPADNQAIIETGGLENVLHEAANDPNNPTMQIAYTGIKPELLRDEAQAILTGRLEADGIFYAEEILLRCPARYEEAVPEQVQ